VHILDNDGLHSTGTIDARFVSGKCNQLTHAQLTRGRARQCANVNHADNGFRVIEQVFEHRVFRLGH
jgi:hypothetical protein